MVKLAGFPRTNYMKQNDPKFCRPTSAVHPGNHGRFGIGRRQNARIMSLKMGPPATPTKCKHRPENDLRADVQTSRKQNPQIPDRQSVLLRIVGRISDKMRRSRLVPAQSSGPQRPNSLGFPNSAGYAERLEHWINSRGILQPSFCDCFSGRFPTHSGATHDEAA
jgi:hypothetical protein